MTSCCRVLGSGALSSLVLTVLLARYSVRRFRRVRTNAFSKNLPELTHPAKFFHTGRPVTLLGPITGSRDARLCMVFRILALRFSIRFPSLIAPFDGNTVLYTEYSVQYYRGVSFRRLASTWFWRFWHCWTYWMRMHMPRWH